MMDGHPYRAAPLQPPPRHIPRELGLALHFGGAAALTGWLILLMSSLAGWYLTTWADVSSWRREDPGEVRFWSYVLWLVPLLGAALAAGGAWSGRRALRLLREGRLARGKLIDKRQTRFELAEKPVYLLTFSFEAADGRTYRAVARTEKPAALEDDEEEPLVYLPADPHQACLLDHLPGGPVIRADGTLAARRPGWGGIVALPLLIVAINLVGVGLRLLR
jgi:hypothetical protein